MSDYINSSAYYHAINSKKIKISSNVESSPKPRRHKVTDFLQHGKPRRGPQNSSKFQIKQYTVRVGITRMKGCCSGQLATLLNLHF